MRKAVKETSRFEVCGNLWVGRKVPANLGRPHLVRFHNAAKCDDGLDCEPLNGIQFDAYSSIGPPQNVAHGVAELDALMWVFEEAKRSRSAHRWGFDSRTVRTLHRH